MASLQNQSLARKSLVLGVASMSRSDAIRYVGKMLVDRGHVDPEYVDSMLEREETVSTFLGNGVAMPHGTFDGKAAVRSTGIVVVQCPEGVDWGVGTAHLIIGLAAIGDDHIQVLAHIAEVLQDEALAETLWTTEDPELLFSTLEVPPAEQSCEGNVTADVVIASGTGLHARPASLIVELTKGFDGEVVIAKGGRSAKANSILGLLALGAVAGDGVVVTVAGENQVAGHAITEEIKRILTTPESEV